MIALLADLTLRGTLAALLAIGFTRLAAIPVPVRRLGLLLAALAFLLPIRLPVTIDLPADPHPTAPPATHITTHITTPLTTFLTRPGPPTLPADWTTALLAIWSVGALLTALRLATSAEILRRSYARHPLCTDPATLELIESVKRRTGVHTPFAVLLVDEPISPALWGWIRPRLLLPRSAWNQLDPDQRESVLLHEFAHARSADIAARWLLALVTTVHWFNPFAHLLLRALADLQEKAADAYVLRTSHSGVDDYAATLLRIVRSCAPAVGRPAIGIFESPNQLKTRIHSMKTPTITSRHRLLASTLAILAILTVIIVRPVASADSDAKAAATQAMQTWLKLIDSGKFARSYQSAATSFQEALTESDWIAALEEVRAPLGNVVSRKLMTTTELTTLPDGTTGNYVMAQFNTAFAADPATVETVTFEQEPDGRWAASGYFIRPGSLPEN